MKVYCSLCTQEVVEGYEMNWLARTLRTRELPGAPGDEVMNVKLSREDLVALANQGLAFIEQQASEASGVAPHAKCMHVAGIT